jgi:hypothetical protein
MPERNMNSLSHRHLPLTLTRALALRARLATWVQAWAQRAEARWASTELRSRYY